MWEFEWGPHRETLEAVVSQTGGKIVPKPLLNRPQLFAHLIDIIDAVNFCESRGHQFTTRTPVAEIAAYYTTFSTYDGGPVNFLKLFRLVEKLRERQRERDKKDGGNKTSNTGRNR